jgi:hypothetical protein
MPAVAADADAGAEPIVEVPDESQRVPRVVAMRPKLGRLVPTLTVPPASTSP